MNFEFDETQETQECFLDVCNYKEEMYWEPIEPTYQSECCGEPINVNQAFMISTKVIPSVCPCCQQECEFLIITGPKERPEIQIM